MLLGAVPALAGLVGRLYLAGSDGRVTRKIEKDSALLGIVPDSCKLPLEDLITKEVELHVQRRNRKLDWSAVAAAIIVAAVTAAVGFGLALTALEYWWPIWFLFVPVTLFGFILTLIGFNQIFKYPVASSDGVPEVKDAG